MSTRFMSHLRDHGIVHLVSCPATPQQNGLAERIHRHLTELGLSMLFQSHTFLRYWVEAFYTANFISNIIPSAALQQKIYLPTVPLQVSEYPQDVSQIPTGHDETPPPDNIQASSGHDAAPSTPERVSEQAQSVSDHDSLQQGTTMAPEDDQRARHSMTTRSQMGIRKPNPRYALVASKTIPSLPQTVAEALAHPGWRQAMLDERDVLSKQQSIKTKRPAVADYEMSLSNQYVPLQAVECT
ncbi:hypothetical protein YC2023_043792 [Brassica napus]